MGRHPAARGCTRSWRCTLAATASTTRSCAAGLAGLDAFTIEDDRGRRLEACQSPVWDTALAVIALADAGAEARRPGAAPRRPTGWSAEEITVRGDWSVRRPAAAPGGWAFEFANDWYPDIDDTAEVVLALVADRDGPTDGPRSSGRRRGCSACSAATAAGPPSTSTTPGRCAGSIPFCDFGELIDPPSADVTAHIVEMLADDRTPRRGARARASHWLLGAQEADGSWFGRWGANYVYGTGAVGAGAGGRRAGPGRPG